MEAVTWWPLLSILNAVAMEVGCGWMCMKCFLMICLHFSMRYKSMKITFNYSDVEILVVAPTIAVTFYSCYNYLLAFFNAIHDQ
jgi:hypothetical protein